MNTGLNRFCLTALIVLVGVQANAQEEQTPTPAPTPAAESQPTLQLELRNAMTLTGTPLGMEAIKVNTLFGEVDIPFVAIAGVRFGKESTGPSTIVLRNGDSITGEILMTDVEFVSQWGQATVHTNSIRSIVLVSGVEWGGESSIGGQRWTLLRTGAEATASQTSRSRTR